MILDIVEFTQAGGYVEIKCQDGWELSGKYLSSDNIN